MFVFNQCTVILLGTCLTYCFRVSVSAVSSLVCPAHGLICCYLCWCDIFEQINLIWFDLKLFYGFLDFVRDYLIFCGFAIFCNNTHLLALCLELLGWTSTRKVKPVWILLKQETVSGNGISWAICKSALCSRHATTPAPITQLFTGQMLFLLPNQQHQSTEGIF